MSGPRREARRPARERRETELLLLHHALGRTDGVLALADGLRAAGLVVHVPDLFDGATFATLEEGVAHAAAIGFERVVERGVRAADGLGRALVPVGISLGALPAERLALVRPGVRRVVLLHACAPPTDLGGAWPAGVPVQVHGMLGDPWFAGEGDLDAARALVAATPGSELVTYPGDAHLFAEPGQPGYDVDAAIRMLASIVRFVADRAEGRPRR